MVVIDLAGSIDAQADEGFNEAYSTADNLNYDTIALNFSDVDYINSTGIALIVELLAQARKSKKHLIVYGLSEHYVEVFQITRLSDFMDIYQAPDEKVAAKVSLITRKYVSAEVESWLAIPYEHIEEITDEIKWVYPVGGIDHCRKRIFGSGIIK